MTEITQHMEREALDGDTGSTWLRKLMSIKIGPMPWPVFLATAVVTILATYTGKLPNDVIGGLSVMMLAGFLLGKLGNTIPILKDIGGTAILCLFCRRPSWRTA